MADGQTNPTGVTIFDVFSPETVPFDELLEATAAVAFFYIVLMTSIDPELHRWEDLSDDLYEAGVGPTMIDLLDASLEAVRARREKKANVGGV